MNQYKLLKSLLASDGTLHNAGELVDNTIFSDAQLANTDFFAPYDPAQPWQPMEGDVVYAPDETMKAVRAYSYTANNYQIGYNVSTRLADFLSLGLLFPDQDSAQAALDAMLATLQPVTNELVATKAQVVAEPPAPAQPT